jgi:hypothetical protein
MSNSELQQLLAEGWVEVSRCRISDTLERVTLRKQGEANNKQLRVGSGDHFSTQVIGKKWADAAAAANHTKHFAKYGLKNSKANKDLFFRLLQSHLHSHIYGPGPIEDRHLATACDVAALKVKQEIDRDPIGHARFERIESYPWNGQHIYGREGYKLFPKLSGVYVFVARGHGVHDGGLYVGSALDFRERMTFYWRVFFSSKLEPGDRKKLGKNSGARQLRKYVQEHGPDSLFVYWVNIPAHRLMFMRIRGKLRKVFTTTYKDYEDDLIDDLLGRFNRKREMVSEGQWPSICVKCSRCGVENEVDMELEGRKVKCTDCGASIQIPKK